MLISELSSRSGISPATIKYYVREGLLPAGEREGGNRTRYGDAHVHRLRLIRALLEVGKLSVGSAASVLAALDDPTLPIGYTFEVAQNALARDAVASVEPPSGSALERVDGVVARAGWAQHDDNVGRRIVAQTLDAFARLGHPLSDAYLDSYAAGALLAAEADLDAVTELADRSTGTELMVVGTVLGDTLAIGLRRIAQAHVTHRRSL